MTSGLPMLGRGVGPVLALVLAAVAGCSSSGESSTAPAPSASAAVAPPAPAIPVVGSCHALTLTEATDPVDSRDPVPCSQPHTSVTFKVGKLDPVIDGHLLAVDSRTVRNQIAQACSDSPGAFLGGDRTARRLSKFEVVWFGPSLEEADAGANWYRCDVVAVRTRGQLLALPARLRDVLDQKKALDRFGTCGTAAPDRPAFVRVVCAQRHSWRAVEVVELPMGGPYRASVLATTGDAACGDIAAKRAAGALERTWSFERPTRAQWSSGQRFGYCWVPEG